MRRIQTRSLGIFEGGIEVVEAVLAEEDGRPNHNAVPRVIADIQTVADAAGVRTRGSAAIEQAIRNGEARYLLARTVDLDYHRDDTYQTLAAARVRLVQHKGWRRNSKSPMALIEGIETTSRGLVPVAEQAAESPEAQLAIRGAGLILYRIAAEQADNSGVVDIEGRRGNNFQPGTVDPRQAAFFHELGFGSVPGAPMWETEGGTLTGLAKVIEQRAADLYVPYVPRMQSA